MSDLTQVSSIESRIQTIRAAQVMIDADLAHLYGVETKVLNQAVKRNIARFPQQFRFQLNPIEKNELVTNCDRFGNLKHSTTLPYAFTEQGVAMLSAVLRSETAVRTSIQIIDAFVKMRQFLAHNADIFKRLDRVEKRQLSHEIKTDEQFEQLFTALDSKTIPPKQGIFYDGQIFDAYVFIADLIRTAHKSIVIIDNYIDETVLTLLSKRKQGVAVKILTKTISAQLQLDITKFNQQYPPITVAAFEMAHDRFLIIDEKAVYHIGASLKDLGKKWFAFSKMEMSAVEMLARVEL